MTPILSKIILGLLLLSQSLFAHTIAFTSTEMLRGKASIKKRITQLDNETVQKCGSQLLSYRSCWIEAKREPLPDYYTVLSTKPLLLRVERQVDKTLYTLEAKFSPDKEVNGTYYLSVRVVGVSGNDEDKGPKVVSDLELALVDELKKGEEEIVYLEFEPYL